MNPDMLQICNKGYVMNHLRENWTKSAALPVLITEANFTAQTNWTCYTQISIQLTVERITQKKKSIETRTDCTFRTWIGQLDTSHGCRASIATNYKLSTMYPHTPPHIQSRKWLAGWISLQPANQIATSGSLEKQRPFFCTDQFTPKLTSSG
jgi:hypothetical protein